MSENIQFICTINNRTSETLKVQSTELKWGKFDDSPNFWPIDIPARSEKGAFRSSGRQSSSSGTEGTVTYQLGDKKDEWIKIYWDVPWLSGARNTLKVETFDEDVLAAVHGFTGGGAVESVVITVADARVK